MVQTPRWKENLEKIALNKGEIAALFIYQEACEKKIDALRQELESLKDSVSRLATIQAEVIRMHTRNKHTWFITKPSKWQKVRKQLEEVICGEEVIG